ncbi:MAG: hypothetical protein ACYC26_05100 [Phycisphaerales bacterium]
MPHLIHVKTETQAQRGWIFAVEILDDGQTRDYTVSLDWSDYDLWSHGRVAPEKVIDAAFRFLLQREPASAILPKFDCALIRRYFPEIDTQLKNML